MTKTKPPLVYEATIQRGILDMLALRGIPRIRTNAGAGLRPKKNGGYYVIQAAPEGWPDITGIVPGPGWLLGIECKRPGERPTPDQVATLRAIIDAGGVAFWSDDVAEATDVITELLKGHRITMNDRGDWRIVRPTAVWGKDVA